MNGRERTLRALDLGQPDIVPTYVHAMNVASIIRIGRHFAEGLPEVMPLHLMTPRQTMNVADTLMLIHEELDIDGITAVPLESEEDIGGQRFRNEWGIVKERSPHGLPVPVGHPIGSAADLDAYRRPTPDPHKAAFVARIQRDRFHGRKALYFMVRGVFTSSWYLRGMERLLMDFVRAPELVERLARLVTDYDLELLELAAAHGVDVIVLDDDLADKHNALISPRHYRRLVAPFHRELVERAHALGMKVLLHTDGRVWPLLEAFVEVGFDGLNPLEPDAGMELGEVKRAVGDRLCLVGNIDCGALLCHGTTEDVEAEVVRAIAAGAPGGGYILCDSNSIHPGVRPENFIAMMHAARRHGAYAP